MFILLPTHADEIQSFAIMFSKARDIGSHCYHLLEVITYDGLEEKLHCHEDAFELDVH